MSTTEMPETHTELSLRLTAAGAAAVRNLFDVQRDHHADPKVMGWLLRQVAERGWSEEQLLGRPPTAPAAPRWRVPVALGPGAQLPKDA